MKKIYEYKIILILSCISMLNSQDPFTILGIPALNPTQILKETNMNIIKENKKEDEQHAKNSIKSIEDLPKILKESNITDNERLNIISRFVIADDFLLKKLGAVFDQTGFDGLIPSEQIYPTNPQEKFIQRARSASNIFLTNNEAEKYDSYTTEELKINQLPNGWHIFKVLMICRSTGKEQIFVKVCLPEDEMLVPIVVKFKENCIDSIKYVEQAKEKNAPNLEKIGNSILFMKKKTNNRINLNQYKVIHRQIIHSKINSMLIRIY